MFTFTVPYIQASSGSYMVYATGQQSGVTASQWFYQEWPYMSWAYSNSGAPGRWETVYLYSFLPNETVAISYNGTALTTCPVDRNGNSNSGTCGFQIPTGNPAGSYPVTFQGRRWASPSLPRSTRTRAC